MAKHQNNFNLIRLAAATQVLIVHVANHIGFDHPLLSVLKLFPGVPIFFFISGYLIYASFNRLTPSGWKTFYLNRVVRIYPALIACTALGFASVRLTGYFTGRGVSPLRIITWLLGQITIVQFYNPPFMRGYGVGVMNGALWTIAVELQFYLLVPVLYLLLHQRRVVWVALLAVSLMANVATKEALDWDSMSWKLFYVSFVPWVYMFLIGFGVSSLPALQQRILRINVWPLLAAFVASMYLVGNVVNNSSNSINPVSVVILSMLLLKLAWAKLGSFGRIFQTTDISYGLYVYHIPVINLLLYATTWDRTTKVVVSIVVSFVLAALSWFVIEKPALDLKKRYDRGARTAPSPVT